MRHFPESGILTKMPHAAFAPPTGGQNTVHWYRTGVDVERRLPILSTYLGHTKVTDTYWYPFPNSSDSR